MLGKAIGDKQVAIAEVILSETLTNYEIDTGEMTRFDLPCIIEELRMVR